LSANAEAKWTEALVKLVNDKDISVAREAASGLGRIADPKARKPLLDALRKADKDGRLRFIEALRDGIGGVGLVLALDTVAVEPEARHWFQTRQLFDMLHGLKDPRIGDALLEWAERVKPHVHWQTETGIALAEVGDARGAKFIGERMGVENKDIYIKEKFWQADKGGHMTKNDRARVVGARMLADLAVLYPDKHEQLRDLAAAQVLKWMTSRPQPHANGLRFLAASGSKKALPKMRQWAFPTDALPKEGSQPPFPQAFETAQSGLRYIGWMRDAGSLSKLLDQFDRKDDDKMDITLQGMMGAGRAMLGMALRAVAYGASNGLAQWGKQKGDKVEKTLFEFIEDELWNEEARMQACRALPWVASDDAMKTVVEKVGEFAEDINPRKQFIAACYAETLSLRPVPDAVGMMVGLITPDLAVGLRNALGHAIGVTGLKGKDAERDKLFALIEDAETRNASALALILGGDRDTAARTVAKFADAKHSDALNALKDLYFRAFGYWSDADLDNGNLYRWVRNARAIARVKIGDAPQEWAKRRLKAQFDNLMYDNGPHSETRVVLQHRLLQAAKSNETRRDAIETLKFMNARGALMALGDEPGETGKMAARAFHELRYAKVVVDDELTRLQAQDKN
jgi:HEAT repeat protein